MVRSPARRSKSVAVLQIPRLRADESGFARYARTSLTTAPTSVVVVSIPKLTLTVGGAVWANARMVITNGARAKATTTNLRDLRKRGLRKACMNVKERQSSLSDVTEANQALGAYRTSRFRTPPLSPCRKSLRAPSKEHRNNRDTGMTRFGR